MLFTNHSLPSSACSYELSFAAKAGFGVAVQQCVELGIERIWARIQQLAGMLRSGLQALQGVLVQDKGRQLCGLVSFFVEGMSGGPGILVRQ